MRPQAVVSRSCGEEGERISQTDSRQPQGMAEHLSRFAANLAIFLQIALVFTPKQAQTIEGII